MIIAELEQILISPVMGKNKLRRWEELKSMQRVFQPDVTYHSTDCYLKGTWSNSVFLNKQPIILEAGCGKGEYSVEMAKKFPHKNFIGMDIKGARIWRGAKTINEQNITNAAFLRLRIELIEKFFAPDEADEIWLTFPDPQPQKSRENRRLTSPAMLHRFKSILKSKGLLHLKTDSLQLMEYSAEMLQQQTGKMLFHTFDLDASGFNDERLFIQTTYEKIFRSEGKKIGYLCFQFEK